MTLCFEIPLHTVSETNQSEHWGTRHKRKKKQTNDACLITQAAIGAHGPLLTITLTRIAPTRLDQGNLGAAFKGVQDGIARALRIDDGSRAVRWVYEQEARGAKEYSVLVSIEAAGER